MKIICGDSLEVLKTMEDNSVDSICSDPPYGLKFMGKKWDYDVPSVEVWKECLRVLKPGGHALVACGTRTQHRMAVNLEDAGFEIRDIIAYLYGSGFPKSMNINKHLLKKLNCGNIEEYENNNKKTKSQMQGMWKTIIHKTLVLEENKENDRRALSELLEDLEQGEQHKIFTGSFLGEEIQISKRQRESCLERWHDLPTPQGELYCKCKICEMPTGIYIDGKKGWICYGTQTNNGETSWEVIDENGVCSSYQSQALGQSLGELNVICDKCGTQVLRTQGQGTALKPAMELWTLCRKPLEEKTVAANTLKYGTGGINIEKSRVPTQDDEARKQKILSGEVVCNAFCDKHKSYPSSLFDILSFSRLQLYDFYQHIFSELGSYNNSYTNLLHNLEELDYKNYKQLLGVPYDCGLLAGRANEYVHAYQEVLNSQDDCPTLSRLYDVFVRCQKVSDQDVFPLSNDVQVDILHFLSSKENNQLNDNNPLLVFVLALVAYSLLVNNNLHNHYTTCKNKSKGRFPANLIHSGEDEVVEGFPDTKGATSRTPSDKKGVTNFSGGNNLEIYKDNEISASRFFYCAKASKSERNQGLEEFEEKQTVGGGGGIGDYKDDVNSMSGKYGSEKAPSKNNHPTCKPIKLMQYLVRLITPKGGTILDPYIGSGSTGIGAKLEGFDFIGIEREQEYCDIAEARLKSYPKKDLTS